MGNGFRIVGLLGSRPSLLLDGFRRYVGSKIYSFE
jgi:hypothetical protein